MQKITREQYQQRLDRLGAILGPIAARAGEQAAHRCPYKNRFDECTASFGCRNQRRSPKKDGLLTCGADDKLDYRSAWESAAHSRPRGRDGQEGTGRLLHEGRQRPLVAGRTLFDYADQLRVQVPTSCGRTGHCHECIVEVKKGAELLNGRTEAEGFLRENFRLACQARVQNTAGELEFTPLRRRPKILSTARQETLELDPVVQRRGDTVYYGGEPVDHDRGHLYGLALDLGTTTVVLDLVDLERGRSLCVASFENPQRFGGSDIMQRISYDGQFPGELRRSIVNALNEQIEEMGRKLGFARQEIYEIAVAGNSTMRDIFFRLDVQSIGQKPYKSLVEREWRAGRRPGTALLEKTRRLGLRAHPRGRAYGLPLVASHVGADTAAALAATDMAAPGGTTMLLDVGTNTEVVVQHRGRLVAASCPAGPAFEGGLVTCGMPGCEGAIESLAFRDGRFEYRTIGGVEPQGLCGSGLIDLLAELRRHALMTPKGVFADKKYTWTLVPARGITFDRADASNLAQAKAANYCGQYIVLRHLGLGPRDVDTLYLAGAFANYIDVRHAIEIGFLPPVPEERIVKVGNAAAQGARALLLSQRRRVQIENLVQEIEHLELETTPDFFEIFVEACQFKPMPAAFTPAL